MVWRKDVESAELYTSKVICLQGWLKELHLPPGLSQKGAAPAYAALAALCAYLKRMRADRELATGRLPTSQRLCRETNSKPTLPQPCDTTHTSAGNTLVGVWKPHQQQECPSVTSNNKTGPADTQFMKGCVPVAQTRGYIGGVGVSPPASNPVLGKKGGGGWAVVGECSVLVESAGAAGGGPGWHLTFSSNHKRSWSTYALSLRPQSCTVTDQMLIEVFEEVVTDPNLLLGLPDNSYPNHFYLHVIAVGSQRQFK